MLDFRQLDKYQRQAVMHGEGPLLVVAGPGSGKTFTLIHRILYLLHKGVSPENILMITYTNEAAETMRIRFHNSYSYDSKELFVGTFHSFFYHILLENRQISKKSLLTYADKTNISFSVLQHYMKDFLVESRRNEVLFSFLQAMEYYKNTLDDTGAQIRFDAEYRDKFHNIFSEYEKVKSRTGRVDFDDMQFLCLQFLRNNSKERFALQEKYQYILIDEFQDINPVQYEILKLLCGPFCNLFVVGDDDQSIYGFRGSNPKYMSVFRQDFNAKQIILRYNYRSTKEMVSHTLRFIEENKNRIRKPLKSKSLSETKGSVSCKQFVSSVQQTDYLLRRIQEEKEAMHSCAVLFRTNRHLQKFLQYYKEKDCKLLTVHRAKGLEFDTVFIPDCNEGMFPYGWERTLEETEEERRIFYVAATRAKKCLELLTLKGTPKSPRQVSNFLNSFTPQPTRRIRNCQGIHQMHQLRLRIHRHHRYNLTRVLRWGRQGFRYIGKTIPRRPRFHLFHSREEERYNPYRERE